MKSVVNLTSLLLVIFLFVFPVKVCADTPFYTIQVLTTKKRQEAEKAFDRVKEYKDARIDYANKFYKVRIGLFKNKKEAYSFLKNHPEIKKMFPSAYITLNYYNPKRTIKRGKFFTSTKSANKTKNSYNNFTISKGSEKVKNYQLSNTMSNTTLQKRQIILKKKLTNKTSTWITKNVEDKKIRIVYLLIGVLIGCIFALLLIFSFKKYKFYKKAYSIYIAALKNLPIRAAKKMVEHHYLKTGDFKSLLLFKLKENDVNFILRETPKYLLKKRDDILVWKIYIETLANLGLYLDAADACEKLAEILKDSHRPEAAISYKRKAEEYRKKASMKLGNQA